MRETLAQKNQTRCFVPAKPEKDINGAEVDETACENITETLNS